MIRYNWLLMRSTIILISVPKNYVYILDVQLCIVDRFQIQHWWRTCLSCCAHWQPTLIPKCCTPLWGIVCNRTYWLLRTYWLWFHFAGSTIKWNYEIEIGVQALNAHRPPLLHSSEMLHYTISPGRVLHHMLIKMCWNGETKSEPKQWACSLICFDPYHVEYVGVVWLLLKQEKSHNGKCKWHGKLRNFQKSTIKKVAKKWKENNFCRDFCTYEIRILIHSGNEYKRIWHKERHKETERQNKYTFAWLLGKHALTAPHT